MILQTFFLYKSVISFFVAAISIKHKIILIVRAELWLIHFSYSILLSTLWLESERPSLGKLFAFRVSTWKVSILLQVDHTMTYDLKCLWCQNPLPNDPWRITFVFDVIFAVFHILCWAQINYLVWRKYPLWIINADIEKIGSIDIRRSYFI